RARGAAPGGQPGGAGSRGGRRRGRAGGGSPGAGAPPLPASRVARTPTRTPASRMATTTVMRTAPTLSIHEVTLVDQSDTTRVTFESGTRPSPTPRDCQPYQAT